MSNFVVSKGLGGGLLLTDGFGADSDIPIPVANILRCETGSLQVNVRKVHDYAVIYFDDGINQVAQRLTVTANQLANIDWMLVTLTRTGNVTDGFVLNVFLDGVKAGEVPLVSAPAYGGICHVMENKSGGLFDIRLKPDAIDEEAIVYYLADMTENDGKSLLPPIK